jgi:hypothetical protein
MAPRRLPLQKTKQNKKTLKCSGYIEFSTVLHMLDSVFPRCCSTSVNEMPPFNKSKIFTLSFKLNYFYLILRAPFALERYIFTKLRPRTTRQITQ